MQGLSFGTGDTPQPTQKSSENISIDDLFKPNHQCKRDQGQQQTTPSSAAEGQSTSTDSEGAKTDDDTEYVSEDFVISRIDSSGNMRRGNKK